MKESNRKINQLRWDKHESIRHKLIKGSVSNILNILGHDWIMEARFKNGSRADILDLDAFTVYECVVSESEQSLQNKAKKYPRGLTIKVVRV